MRHKTWEGKKGEHGITGESMNHHLYSAISHTLPSAHPMAGTLEVKWQWILTTPASVSWALCTAGTAWNHKWVTLTENTQAYGGKKRGWRMSSRGGNEFRGWGIFDMIGGSYLLAAASPLPTKGLSYFLWTETETPINPGGRAHRRLLLRT